LKIVVDNICKRTYNRNKRCENSQRRETMPYANLLAELKRRNISQETLSKTLGVSPNTLTNKLKGKSDFSLKEIKIIKNDVLNKQCDFDYLFKD
jgi:transcriptional regulator with XRE-family HTH domain